MNCNHINALTPMIRRHSASMNRANAKSAAAIVQGNRWSNWDEHRASLRLDRLQDRERKQFIISICPNHYAS